MRVVSQPLSCYYLETDGDIVDDSNNSIVSQHQNVCRSTETHGCLPADVDLALAFGVLKTGYFQNPHTACLTLEPLAKIRHEVFASFNKCLVRCLTGSCGHFDEDSAARSKSATSCQMCDFIQRLAAHCSTCAQHPFVCADYCLLLYNLISYHIATSCHTSCNVDLCNQLRTAFLQAKPMEQANCRFDRVWYALRCSLAKTFFPRQATAVAAVDAMGIRMASSRHTGNLGLSEMVATQSGRPRNSDSRSREEARVLPADADHSSPALRDKRRGRDRSCGADEPVDWAGEPPSSGAFLWNPPGCTSPSNALSSATFQGGGIPTGAQLEENISLLTRAVDESRYPRTADLPASDIQHGAASGSIEGLIPQLSVFESTASAGATARDDLAVAQRLSGSPVGEPFDSHLNDQPLAQAQHPMSHYSFSDDSRRPMAGHRVVEYGEPRHLFELVHYWRRLQERLENGLPMSVDNTDGRVSDMKTWEGIILAGKNSELKVQNGSYQKRIHWTKQTFLGRGVSGYVYLAIDNLTEFNFVVKKVDLHHFNEDELCVWAELEHPGIVQLYGALRRGHKLYYLCEFYGGGTLASLVERCRALDQWKAMFYLDQILNALQYLHEKRIIHEDLKADNIYLKLESHIVGIGDFGLSRKLKPGQNSVVAGTQPLGGQTQWSPEKARSEGHGFPADIWAAVCTMVHMLSGRYPWEARFRGCTMLHYIISENSPPIDDIPKGLQDDVKDLIMTGWTVDPRCRPSASQLLLHYSFDHLRTGWPGDAKYMSHFPLLELEDHVTDCSSSAEDDLAEELDEEGANYIAEIVERVKQEPGPAGQEATLAQPLNGSAVFGEYAGHLLSTEHDLLSSSAPRRPTYAVAATFDDWSTNGFATPGSAREEEKNKGSSYVNWNAGAAGRLQKPARSQTKPEAIEEEKSESLGDPLTGRTQSEGDAEEKSSSSGSGACLPSLSPGAAEASLSMRSQSGSRLKRGNLNLHLNVRASGRALSPASPVRQLRHSHSVDSSQAVSPNSGGSPGSAEVKPPRSLKHTVTSPSILEHFAAKNDQQRRETPPSAEVALKSSDLHAVCTPAHAADQLPKRFSTASSSAYNSGTPLHLSASSDKLGFTTPVKAAVTPSSGEGCSAKGNTTRDSSQGYGTGGSSAAAGEGSAFAVFYGSSVKGTTFAGKQAHHRPSASMCCIPVTTPSPDSRGVATSRTGLVASSSSSATVAKSALQSSISAALAAAGVEESVPKVNVVRPAAQEDNSQIVITSLDYEMEQQLLPVERDDVLPVRVSGEDPELNLHLTAEQGEGCMGEPAESPIDEEYLSMLKASLNYTSLSPHASFVAGDNVLGFTKDQEICKLKLSTDMAWQDVVLLVKSKIHGAGFRLFTAQHEDGSEFLLHEKVPYQSVKLIVKLITNDNPWQWWVCSSNSCINYRDDDGHHGLFLDNRP